MPRAPDAARQRRPRDGKACFAIPRAWNRSACHRRDSALRGGGAESTPVRRRWPGGSTRAALRLGYAWLGRPHRSRVTGSPAPTATDSAWLVPRVRPESRGRRYMVSVAQFGAAADVPMWRTRPTPWREHNGGRILLDVSESTADT